MKMTTLLMALLLCAHSFKVDAGAGTLLRNAMRATTTKVGSMSSKVKSLVGVSLATVALCAGMMACDRAPSYVDNLAGVVDEQVSEMGISSADAAIYEADKAWKDPSIYDGLLVVFKQDKLLEIGIASHTGRHNEVVITDLERENGRRTIIKTWQIRGVLINDSELVGDNIEIESRHARLKETDNVKVDQAARQVLWHKDATIYGEVVSEFSDGWLLFYANYASGMPTNDKKPLDLGIRVLEHQNIYLFARTDNATLTERKEE